MGSNTVEGWCAWGPRAPATLIEAAQGMYHVRFRSGGTRWATAPELVLPHVEPSPGQVIEGGTVFVPQESNYVDGIVLQHLPPDGNGARCEVRISDESGGSLLVAVRELRLPVASPATLGQGIPLAVGDKLFALGGDWRRASVRPRQGDEHEVRIGDDLQFARVSSGRVVLMDEPDSALLPGAHVLVLQGDGAEEARVDEDTLSAAPTVNVTMQRGGERQSLPISSVRQRPTGSYRVLATAGGYQRGVIAEMRADGICAFERGQTSPPLHTCRTVPVVLPSDARCVIMKSSCAVTGGIDLVGGACRWVSCAELAPARSAVSSQANGAASSGARLSLEPGAMVAVAPPAERGGVDTARWMSAAIVRSSNDMSVAPRDGQVPLPSWPRFADA